MPNFYLKSDWPTEKFNYCATAWGDILQNQLRYRLGICIFKSIGIFNLGTLSQKIYKLIFQILEKFCYLDLLWRHQMQTFYMVLALCAGNEFPSQGPVTRSFDVFFHLCLNNNHEAGDLRSHRAHYDVIVMWNDWIRWQLWTCQASWALITCIMATWCAQYFWCKCHMCFDNIGFRSLWYVYEIDPWSSSLGCVVVRIVNGPPPMIYNQTMRHTLGNLWYGQINDYLFVSITD